MFAGKKSAQIREILISESAWEEMTCLFAPSLKIFLHQPTRYYKTHPAPGASVQFTEREKKVIQLISNGEAVASIGRSLNLHIKTIYQIRLNLIKKLGCSGRTDFFNISRSETFKSWSQIHL